ncbi:MAG: 3'(2'),5'-bisphosphate nucleotidase CysQ [Saprospiraceae bacterium]|nr:3'(2'),5'-bisphosphate nucleotidase CysQ [Pyrinomonadaceae bacterium]
MLEKELEIAIALAKRAGTAIMRYYAREIIQEEKIGVDNFAEPVTAADREASRIITNGLADAFPDDAILSEEEIDDTDRRLASNRVWIIDPIDGTSGFIKKNGDFAVQIGLAENGKPVVGVVLFPARNAFYYAFKENGAYLVENDKAPVRMHVSGETDFSKMNLAVSRNHRSPNMSRIVREFGLRTEVQRGSVGLKVGLITERLCDLYIHLSSRTKSWDTCGPQIILEESGGRMTDIFGQPMRYDLYDVQNHNGILASNDSSHLVAVDTLRPLLSKIGRLKIKSLESRP